MSYCTKENENKVLDADLCEAGCSPAYQTTLDLRRKYDKLIKQSKQVSSYDCETLKKFN